MTPALLLLAATAGAPAPDLKLPPGFRAELVADNDRAPDATALAIDADGRTLVGGRGYVRILDGDRAVDIVTGLRESPMGLLAEGDSLFVVADGGLKRYRGYDGRTPLKNPELLLALKTGGEHDAHAVRRGPDGWLYLLCGNMAGVTAKTNTGPLAPVKNPVAGALVRLSPDFKQVEVVADGFRNPYSFDFNPDGEPFTYDSDNERCVGLPWYEGCRFLHIVPGGNYGWRSPQRSQTWRKPPHFPDVVKPIADLGRGSPTGVACYRHTHFPEKYRGGFFLADWTFGRIHFVPLKPSGSTYEGQPEAFAEPTGTSGFAPTALAVHPKTGALVVSVGGRGTRGGVYRITFEKGDPNPQEPTTAARTLDVTKEAAAGWVREAETGEARTRRRALELLTRHRTAVTWDQALKDAVTANLSSPDPLVRAAAARAAVALVVPVGDPPPDGPPSAAQLAVALEVAAADPDWAVKVARRALADLDAKPGDLLAATRIIHLAHGDLTSRESSGTVWEGYTLRTPAPAALGRTLTNLLHAQSRRGNQPREVLLEFSRLRAALGTLHGSLDGPDVPLGPEAPQVDDFHYLACAARAGGPALRRNSFELADAVVRLPLKVREQNVTLDRHWPLRFDELLAGLADHELHAKLGSAVLTNRHFGHPDHAALVQPLKLDARSVAKTFLARSRNDPKYPWTPAAVALLAELRNTDLESLLPPLLDDLWARPGLEDAALRVMAQGPRGADRPKLAAGLKSLDGNLVRACALALAKLPPLEGQEVPLNAVRALRRFPDPKADWAARDALGTLLKAYSGEPYSTDPKVWSAWFAKAFPGAAKELDSADGFDPAAWNTRLAAIDWAKGDAARGRVAFTKATCAACHDGGRAVGPSLVGITGRFGRDDLLTATLQPSKDVPARYRPTRVTTTDEKSYLGVIVYDAPDGLILQTGADTTVRVAGSAIATRKLVEVSLMPSGLLDKLTDAEIADLFAYLGTLK